MKFFLLVIFLLPAFFGCVSEEEKKRKEKIEQLRKEVNEIIAGAIAKLRMREYLDYDSALKVMEESARIFIDSAELSYEYAMYWDSISKHIPPKKKTLQEYFIANFSNTNFTKNFLDSINHTLTDWVGKIEMIQLGYKDSDMKLLKQGLSPNEVKEKDTKDRPIDVVIEIANKDYGSISYYATASQVQIKSSSGKFKGGLKPTDPLYKNVLNLEKGQKVRFTSKIIDVKEYKTNIEQSTHFTIELTEINPIR